MNRYSAEGLQRVDPEVSRAPVEELAGEGFRLVSGGPDNHLVLVDVGAQGLTGKESEEMLGAAGGRGAISSLTQMREALAGRAGTWILPDSAGVESSR